MNRSKLTITNKNQFIMKKNTLLKIVFISVMACTNIKSFAVNNNTEITSIMLNNIVTETFKVYGNCGMCEKTIEAALSNSKGIVKADWDKETKMMVVTFHENEISLDEIKKKIAAVGYDTDKFKATDKVYKGLSNCCQYKRPSENKMKDGHEGHNH
ncbi:heavy metal-associated domain-containing protein [Flavicella sp.]|uniref:heavy-metal-associated domain-containing protein n=1 Tax=Flavicella sp. TaxID=2957742 RepID=UPI003016F5F7